MNPVVESGIIAGGAAVAASVVTSALALAITRIQVRAADRAARSAFMAERQAYLYVELGELAERMRAAAGVASEVALGEVPTHLPPPALADERWFAFQGKLRVFGSRAARDTFGDLQVALEMLQRLADETKAGQPPRVQEVATAVGAASEATSRIRTIASAEAGPLRDILLSSARHWWQFRRRQADRQILDTWRANAKT
jgi:hypothetical protein